MPRLQTCSEVPADVHFPDFSGSEQTSFRDLLEHEHFTVDYEYTIANFC